MTSDPGGSLGNTLLGRQTEVSALGARFGTSANIEVAASTTPTNDNAGDTPRDQTTGTDNSAMNNPGAAPASQLALAAEPAAKMQMNLRMAGPSAPPKMG